MIKLNKHFISFAATATLLTITSMTALAGSVGTGVVTGSKVNMRTNPSTSAEIVQSLPRDAQVQVHAYDDSWYKVEYASVVGYMSADYLSVVLPDTKLVATGGAELRASPSNEGAVLSTLAEGTAVNVGVLVGEWLEVTAGEATGYIHSDFLIDAPQTAQVEATDRKGMIIGSVVNLREQPTTASGVLTQLRNGTAVLIKSAENGWTKVSYGDLTGYVSSEYLRDLSGTTSRGSDGSVSAATGDKASALITYAKTLLGVPYRYGGTTTRGFDCSGYVQYVYRNALGISLPRTGTTQYNAGTKVSKSELQVGDIVAFRSRSSKSIQHVGIYIGDGKFIHSSSPGDVVKIDTLNSGYYNTYYYGASRIFG